MLHPKNYDFSTRIQVHRIEYGRKDVPPCMLVMLQKIGNENSSTEVRRVFVAAALAQKGQMLPDLFCRLCAKPSPITPKPKANVLSAETGSGTGSPSTIATPLKE